MRTSIKIFLTLFVLTAVSAKIYTQDDMMMPKPLDNKIYDAMTGEWTGESEMMGMKYQEDMKIYWTLNHQFIIMEIKDVAKDNPKMTYDGIGIFGVDKNGNAKMWWFDDWGTDAMATGSGTFEGNTLKAKSTNPTYTDERTFEIQDGNLVSNWTSTMQGNDGKEIKMSGKTVYKKK